MPVRIIEDAIIECCVPSCKRVVAGTLDFALRQGWRNIVPSTHEPPTSDWRPEWVGRTHIGFCSRCSRKFSATGTDLPERRKVI